MDRKPGAALLTSLAGLTQGRPGEVIELEGVTGPARAAAIVDFCRAREKPVLAVCPDEEQALALARDLGFFMGVRPEEPDFLGEQRLLTLLPEELSPFEARKFLPSRLRRMELLAALYSLTQPFRPAVCVTSAWGLMRRYIPKRALLAQCEYLLNGAEIDREKILKRLVENGYTTTPVVEDAGTFSARGGIVDVFSPLYRQPLRIEFNGDILESIRLFNPTTQKSSRALEEAYLLPVREIVLSPDARARGAERIEKLALEKNGLDRQIKNMLTDLEQGLYSNDLDPFFPLFYEELSPLFAYLSSETTLFIDDPAALEGELNRRFEGLATQQAERALDDDVSLRAADYALDPEECRLRLDHAPRLLSHRVYTSERPDPQALRFAWDDHEGLKMDLAARRGHVDILEPLLDRLRGWLDEGFLVFLVSRTENQGERLTELLAPHGIKTFLWRESFAQVWPKLAGYRPGQAHLIAGALKEGQVWVNERVVFLCEEDIFGERRARTVKTVSFDKEAFLTSLDELSPGDFIVHVEFGIGVYRGLEHLAAGGVVNDFLHIDYLAGDKLYLPVTRLEKVQKFSGADGKVPHLDRLGGSHWAVLKGKVKAAILEMAKELVELYAARKAAEGYAFSPLDAYFREFEAAFPYEETRDQERAIQEVLADMQKPKPMDRLVCGDVGFGKTEVAMRAAFKAALDHKQVAVLVPTTVLAFQHAQTFTERFKGYPVVVESLSRFKSPKEQKEAIRRLKTGEIDLMIGTHRLLSKDVEFADLGLLVVDEEQRFGVKHKERLKRMRQTVDVLTMTATPIPRTLNMAFSGVRDISIIQTPPADRLSIRTFVCRFDEAVIKEAITNELARGGQVFFVHNRVESIQAMAALVKRLVPEARVAVGHGQLSEAALEEVMLAFLRRETNVLVSTTIIESGIDIPTVNTMIVNRADTFGLSQLYQLRGRVGRGKERAYAYLLVPSPSGLTKDAQKRLAVLMRFTELGSGFRIASHDLEIRGAGNLLGRQQSGHIAAVGIDLYLELIEEAVRELKGERAAPEVEPQINLFEPAFLPESYIADAALRLHFYKRLSSARADETIQALADEMEDRFGKLPDEARMLIKAIELKARLRSLNAAGLDLARDRVSVNLGPDCALDPSMAVRLVTEKGSPYQLTPEMKLVYPLKRHEMDDPVGAAKKLLQKLAEYGRKAV